MLVVRDLHSNVPYGSNCYLISSNGEFAVIDPSLDYYEAVKQYPEIEGRVKYVLLTHAHFDHILAIDSWADKCEAVCVGFADAEYLSDASKNCYLGFLGVVYGYDGEYNTLADGDILELGDEKITVISCPGHTPGGVSYKISEKVFCGDTVFAKGGYGRCDLPGGDINVLEKTLMKLFSRLPNETVFYPGHGETTTFEDLIYYFM